MQLYRVMSANKSNTGASGSRRTLASRRTACTLGAAGPKPSARRCLFGPVDHQETNDFLREMNRQFDEQKKERWGFDFKEERPVPGGHAVYEWIAVLAGDDIPCAYGRMGESWRQSDNVYTVNENAELWNVEGSDSDRLNDSHRKRLRRLSPNNPGQITAATKDFFDCSSAESGPTNLEVSKPDDGLPLKDLRKSEGKLEQCASPKSSDVPELQEGSGLPSTVPMKDGDIHKGSSTATDNCIMEFLNASYSAVPENK